MIHSTRKGLVDAVISDYNRAVNGQCEQLYNCKAWIFIPDNSEFIILQSYSTIVAVFQRHCISIKSALTQKIKYALPIKAAHFLYNF